MLISDPKAMSKADGGTGRRIELKKRRLMIAGHNRHAGSRTFSATV
jgi:hypothetical protein